jgi:aryl-alcohol dehydrogenase-like predicted oxidoreductase
VLARGRDIVPIPGTKRRKYLEDNLKAAELSLSAADLARIESLFPKGAAHGPRYPEAIMKLIRS